VLERINHRLWRQYQQSADDRAWLIAELVSQQIEIKNCRIVDLGCGVGSAVLELAHRGASVTAIDLNHEKLSQLRQRAKLERLGVEVIEQDIMQWRTELKYDAIIVWDVLEHLMDPTALFKTCYSLLSPSGLLFISTPNRTAPTNLLFDPHYSLPMLALAKRSLIRKILVDGLHWFDQKKNDWAQLVSWPELEHMLSMNGLTGVWVVRQVAELALSRPQAVWNRSWHLRIIDWLLAAGLGQAALGCLSNEPGQLYHRLMPTFYVLARKK
jgi:SAM-dependent methyltransferase